MQQFINNITSFVLSIYVSILDSFRTLYTQETATAYMDFLDKNIINGSLINISLTYKELLLYLSVWVLAIFFIVMFVKLCYKVLGLFKL